MLTVPATVCIAGARTKRGLIFTSIRTAWGCPGLLQGQGRSSPLGWGCSVLSRHIHGGAWELWPGDVSSAADRQPLPRVLLLPQPCLGEVSHPQPTRPPRGGAPCPCHASSSPLSSHFRCLSPETHKCPSSSIPMRAPCRDALL